MRLGTSFILGMILSLNVVAQNPQAPREAMVVSGNARFTVLTPNMIRIEYSDKGQFEDRATFTIQNRQLESVPKFKTIEDDNYLYITTNKVKLKYRKGTNPMTLPASDQNLSITMTHNGESTTWFPGKEDPLNLKGTCRTLDGCNGDSKRSEMENGLISRSGWAVIDDSWTTRRPDGSHSFALEPDAEMGYDWMAERKDPQALDLYFMGYGNEYKKAIGDFTKIAGKIPLPPAYVFGYWYSRYYIYTADDFRNIVNEIRKNDIPADVMILDMDWHWTGRERGHSKGIGGWTGWSWNTNLIPDPAKLLNDIHDKDFKISLNLHPADGIDSLESPTFYKAMTSELGGKYSHDGKIDWAIDYPDFTKSFFKNVIRNLESTGVDFWWLDWQQHLTSHFTSGLGETFWCNHVFFNDMAKNRPDRRPMIFHRWGGLGSHRYQIGFSGDALINFPTLAFEPYFTATASNVGYAFWGHDLGGHTFTDASIVNDPELMLRWIQFGIFTPIFRSHATNETSIERRIWKFPNFKQLRDAVQLRYTFIPYIYTMARETYDTGIGMCRPLYYEYPNIEEAYKYENEYFFGNDILVAPITEPAGKDSISTKEVWFPEGNWWSVATNELIQGPCLKTLQFTQDQIPYFFKEGSMIPLNPPTVRTVTAPTTSLILNAVAGADGIGSLYEDAGDNPDYATAFATTQLTHKVKGNTETYTIEPRKGNATRLVDRRAWTLNIMNASEPTSVKVNGKKSNWEYNVNSKTLTINIPQAPCTSKNEIKVKYTD